MAPQLQCRISTSLTGVTRTVCSLRGTLVLRRGRFSFRGSTIPPLSNNASPFDQRQSITGEPLRFVRVDRASGALQRLNSGTAQRCGFLFLAVRIAVHHGATPGDRRHDL
jgi:hypothetical protein